ncbi:AP-5 complex subunit zeta-1 isoform X2 [Pezoporus flaviventris]|uniref:AP-5 complex subunit zeta-1 isoform X2 n=1 Tax=Pezoporus flaviventris TaxID=889875 RepID=UPI002AB0C118|nr:AP-5 complex subunit zeta-1 isoform X2 [Pezoporus flaviventris]
MFTAAAESFLKQAREIQEEELRRFASRVAALLQGPEPGAEAADCLQRLHLTVAATKYPRKLDGKFVELLQTVLCSSKSPAQIQVLCAAILREMSPCNELILSCDKIQDAKLLSLVSSVLLAQGNKKAVSAVGQHVVKVLEGRLPEGQSARYLLPVLSNVVSLSPQSLTEEQTNVVSKKMADWLRHASIQQGVTQSSGGFFSPRSRQPGPVTEVDGAVATDFFTVLSVGQCYTQDQWLNMQAFSMLRKWLLCYGDKELKTPSSDDKSGMDSSVMSVVSATSTPGLLLPPKEHLREKAFEYCQRLIEQSNRRPLKKNDGDLQKACLIEAVTIMDIICKQDSSYVHHAVSFLKTLHGRICGDASYARALLPIAQFFLNHSETAAVDSDAIYKHLFTDIPAQHFHNPSLAFEFVQFCKDNSQLFTETSSIFKQSFPNLFKFLAWNSPPLISEFVDLLPVLLDSGTAVEVFHLLLDLPCLTAALDIQLRLIPLRQLLGSLASSPRVVQCSETVPVLLELFFRVVAEFADGPLINQLVVLLLQRSDQLYEIPAFKDEVFRVLSSQLVVLCNMHPAVIVEASTEILEFSGMASNAQNKGAIFTQMVWAIGEYMSVSYDKRCTVEQINEFFETLEVVLFEITQLRPLASIPHYAPSTISALMATLTKLAARSQDLIPRVSMFLSKMRTFVQSPAVTSVYCEADLEELQMQATELSNLLKMPDVAQFVLTPPAGVGSTGFQREVNDSLPFALRIVTHLLEPAPGCMPR